MTSLVIKQRLVLRIPVCVRKKNYFDFVLIRNMKKKSGGAKRTDFNSCILYLNRNRLFVSHTTMTCNITSH